MTDIDLEYSPSVRPRKAEPPTADLATLVAALEILAAKPEPAPDAIPVSMRNIARHALAAIPPDAVLVTEASLAEALHEVAPEAHKRRECRDRHDLRAAAILAALRAAK